VRVPRSTSPFRRGSAFHETRCHATPQPAARAAPRYILLRALTASAPSEQFRDRGMPPCHRKLQRRLYHPNGVHVCSPVKQQLSDVRMTSSGGQMEQRRPPVVPHVHRNALVKCCRNCFSVTPDRRSERREFEVVACDEQV
jgi:hypothetical protein